MKTQIAGHTLAAALVAGALFHAQSLHAEDQSAMIGVGQISSSIPGADPLSFQTMLETQLIKTNKFHIVERSRLAEILKEKGLGVAGVTGGDKTLSGVQGVDYLVYGTITKLGKSGQAISVPGFGNAPGFGSANSIVEMAVDLRVVDAHNGEIKYADTVQEQAGGGGALAVGGFRIGNSAGDPLADVQRLTAKAITALITTTIYPVRVITRQADGTYVVNYGDSVLTVGDILKVFKLGETFKDPDTGKVLGSEETEIGILKVSETTPNFSKATLVSGAAGPGNTARRISSSDASKAPNTTTRGPRLP